MCVCVWGGGGAFWNFRMQGGGGKISMPPKVGVRIFSGTTHFTVRDSLSMNKLLISTTHDCLEPTSWNTFALR